MEYSCTLWPDLVFVEELEAGSRKGAGTRANTGVKLCRGLTLVDGSSEQGRGSRMLQEQQGVATSAQAGQGMVDQLSGLGGIVVQTG